MIRGRPVPRKAAKNKQSRKRGTQKSGKRRAGTRKPRSAVQTDLPLFEPLPEIPNPPAPSKPKVVEQPAKTAKKPKQPRAPVESSPPPEPVAATEPKPQPVASTDSEFQPFEALGAFKAGAALMIGLSAGLQFHGVQAIFAAEIDPLPATSTLVSVIALLAVALGMAMARRTGMAVRKASRRWTGRFEGNFAQPLLPLTLAGAAAGFLTLFMVVVSNPVFEIYHLLLERFFWTNVTLAALEWAMVGGLLAAPGMAMGMLLTMLSAPRPDAVGSGRALIIRQGAILGGITLATVINIIAGRALSAERLVLVGTLPLFVVAAGGMFMPHWPRRLSVGLRSPGALLTNRSVGVNAVSGLALLIWASAMAAACASWLACRSELGGPIRLQVAALTGGVVLGYAAAAALSARRYVGSGSSIWLCGASIGLVAGLIAWGSESLLAVAAESFAISLAAGVALQTFTIAWQQIRPLGLARMNLMVLGGAGLGLAASQWWGLPQFGAMGTVCVGALILLATGGLVELYDTRPGRSRRLHLGVVFACLAVAILLFPAFTKHWAQQGRQRLAVRVAHASPTAVLAEALADVRTACLIGVDPPAIERIPPGRTTILEVLPLSSWRTLLRPVQQTNRVHVVSMPAPRALRLSHARYHLIYQCMQPGQDDIAAYCSAEWLARLGRHLVGGGTLMLELPLSGLDRRTLIDRAGTFRHMSRSDCWWSVMTGGEPKLLLRSGPVLPHPHVQQTSSWQRLERLLTGDDASDWSMHSMRRRSNTARTSAHGEVLISWLTERAGGRLPLAAGATP